MVEIKDAQIRKIILSFMTLILFSIPVHWASLILWSHPKYAYDIPFLSRHGESSILDSFVKYDPGMMMPNGGVVEFLLSIALVVLVVLLLTLVANSLNMTGRWKINLGFSDQQVSVLMLAMFVIGINVERTWVWSDGHVQYQMYSGIIYNMYTPMHVVLADGYNLGSTLILLLFPILMVVLFLRWIIQDKVPF